MTEEFKWKEEYSVQIRQIDDQHKKLVELIKRLYKAINEGNTEEKLEKILSELVEYSQYHFDTEESYFRKFDFDGADDHIKEHHKFEDKVATFNKKFKNHEAEISFELVDFLEDWLLDHLVVMDQKYVKCFKEHGLK